MDELDRGVGVGVSGPRPGSAAGPVAAAPPGSRVSAVGPAVPSSGGHDEWDNDPLLVEDWTRVGSGISGVGSAGVSAGGGEGSSSGSRGVSSGEGEGGSRVGGSVAPLSSGS